MSFVAQRFVPVVGLALALGCASAEPVPPEAKAVLAPDTRTRIPLSREGSSVHRAVMLQHLETVQAIVHALVDEDFELAKGLTESHLGFFMHRQAMAAQQQPEPFPPAYHDLAVVHHEAAEELARVIPTKDLKQILPRFNGLLKACVACHLEYKVGNSR